MDLEALRYPIGRTPAPVDPLSDAERQERIETIAQLPRVLREAVADLSGAQWDTPYRPGGWTVRQLVHHIADSHLNAIIRFKLALTEQEPSIKPYDEGAWAKLPDTTNTPPEVSLTLIEALHHRWTVLLRSMGSEDYRRTLFHPEHRRSFSLDEMLVTYSWHSAHHLRHITALAEREGW
jgi:uncharacterized damage-inducible protein DinB